MELILSCPELLLEGRLGAARPLVSSEAVLLLAATTVLCSLWHSKKLRATSLPSSTGLRPTASVA